MSYEIEWRPGAIEDITALFEYLVENASLWDARNVTERLITATDRLAVCQKNPLRKPEAYYIGGRLEFEK